MKLLDPSWWIAAWNRFWFAPGSPRNLAAARIIFAAYSLWVLLSRNLAEMSGLPSVFWSQVGASARWRYLVEIYFFSGYAKLMGVGWKWASASNIRNWMLWCTEEEQIRVFHTLGTWIADRPFACWSVGIGTLLFELGLITALFWKWPRRVLVPLVAVFHLGILLAMNLVFLNVPQLLVFVDWDRVVAWFKSQPKADSSRAAPGVA